MTTALTHKEKMQAFRDATDGKRVKMTVNEVSALAEGIHAHTHMEAVNEILIELGWKERETPHTLATRICDALDTIVTTRSHSGLVRDQRVSSLLAEAEEHCQWSEQGLSDESTLKQLFGFLDYRSISL